MLSQNIRATLSSNGSSLGQNIRVSLNTDGSFSSNKPITLRDTRADYNAIDKLTDVDTTTKANNTTLVYNSVTNRYELKQLDTNQITSIDGGTY
jgi:hypothetical protein